MSCIENREHDWQDMNLCEQGECSICCIKMPWSFILKDLKQRIVNEHGVRVQVERELETILSKKKIRS
jgi:hypothetical protein